MADAALYTSEYTAAGRFRNRDIDSHGTETLVLLRTAGGWKTPHPLVLTVTRTEAS